MKAADIGTAITALTTPTEPRSVWDDRLRQALPVLRQLFTQTSGWKFWIRAAIAVVIGAIEAYLDLRGGV